MSEHIHIKGACLNNLKNLDLALPHNELIVVTGVSGSGKSSLAFDTIFAEGQRRYVETFSPYARQFLDRMDKPQVSAIEGIPPGIAIDQTNPVRTSRSTVGTMTELNDHLKLLYARCATLYCSKCGDAVQQDTPEAVAKQILAAHQDTRALVTFRVAVPENFTEAEIEDWLNKQGYTRLHQRGDGFIEVIQDRLRVSNNNRARLSEALEAAFRYGQGQARIVPLDTEKQALEAEAMSFSVALHCARCDIDYSHPTPSLFSFNSPIGACETCRGFGRSMGIDYDLVIPDERKTLREGAIRPWQTETNAICQRDLVKYAKKRKVCLDTPWQDMSEKDKAWVIDGEGHWDNDDTWYGIRRFFDWLESRSYKMHVRVMLSKYRSYTPCTQCGGARLKPEALNWRLGSAENTAVALNGKQPFKPKHITRHDTSAQTGLTLHDVMLLPIQRTQVLFQQLNFTGLLDDTSEQLLDEIRTRLSYLVEVGLGYLTLDRQSRTLSGGEVQRINLTTALGTSLVNTLFVLDEPSIGLHPRDMERVVAILRKLRDAGNTLIVVEHDPQIMLAADRILDMGPGPGEQGGEVVFYGTPKQLMRSRQSLTAQYLKGDRKVSEHLRGARQSQQTLSVYGACEHNLKHVDLHLPLQQLVCITGVSGSGKSTLLTDITYNALSKLKGQPKERVGAHSHIEGHEQIGEIFLVDQTPIGKTTRSNPASYTGAFDVIRKAFAQEPAAKANDYKVGSFSFNSGMRCPSCGGNGFEHIEMQFLSDVYLRCGECNGSRYRSEILAIKMLGADGKLCSIADVLELTVTEALAFFADRADVIKALSPLAEVGLEYVKLGQPVPTLSGGEAQRLKLASHLVKANEKDTEHKLFFFDEPTTGLHFSDIAKLLAAFNRLLECGHSLVVIEHNLDVIAAADWIIDLGPEGGDGGGEIVAEGTPEDLIHHGGHTGAALRDYSQAVKALLQKSQVPAVSEALHPYQVQAKKNIYIHQAREHNLKNIDLEIPRDKFTVITGLSGSGKSTIAFDIIFNEGQRRYLESLNAYARQFVQPAARPDVDAIYGIPPTVAIEQRTSRGGRKSTVATMTEIYHFLRLLFVKLGTQHCPDCNIPIQAQSVEQIAAQLQKQWRGKEIEIRAPLIVARKGYYTDLAKWAKNKGFAQLLVDGEYLYTEQWPRLDRFMEHDIDLPVTRLRLNPKNESALTEALQRALDFGKKSCKVALLEKQKETVQLFSTEHACPSCHLSFAPLDPRLFSYNSKHGWCPTCFGTGEYLPSFSEEDTGEENAWLQNEADQEPETCPQCHGQRLNDVALAVKFQSLSIADLAALSVEKAQQVFNKLKLSRREADIAQDILTETQGRLAFLREVGLGYLTLDRSAPSLSGGEAQRIRLAAQLGSTLKGVVYILDEPTIGLHPRDNSMLLGTLKKLGDKGNTVLVVEHDEETIRAADFVIDLGPGAGVRGGEIVAKGSVEQLIKHTDSPTGRMLATPLQHPIYPPRKDDSLGEIRLHKAKRNNIKGLDIAIPLGKLVGVSGVSGSGKSTLVRDILRPNLARQISHKKGRRPAPLYCEAIENWQAIKRVLEVDQTPIGKTPRSCPATYIGIWDHIRKAFANTTEANIRGYTASRFSFNTKGGRCDQCEGQGMVKVEMSFLPDVKVPCESCHGMRFNRETLSVPFRGKSIGEVLNMSIDEAVDFFAAQPQIHHALCLLQDVGLGYLTLGQQSPTLSGGEAQRIKLVSELSKAFTPTGKVRTLKGHHTLYILDEPTVGLHMADVENLIHVLHRLVDAGNSVIVIEHNLDILAEADWLIDMGPEGGEQGGQIVAQGTPKRVSRSSKKSRTAPFLKPLLS